MCSRTWCSFSHFCCCHTNILTRPSSLWTSKTNRDMNKSQWQCAGEFHSCRAVCGKSGLYVSLAEYLNSCIGSESSERSHFHFSPLLFSVVSWSSPTHLLFSSAGQSSLNLQYIWSGIYILFHYFVPFLSFLKYWLVIFLSQIQSFGQTWCGFAFTQSVFDIGNCIYWQSNYRIDLFSEAKVQECMSCFDTFTVNI